MRRLIPLALVLLALPGCSRDDGEADLPAACSSGAATFVDAIDSAPSAVRVDGTQISDCLAKDASVGDVQLVGSALVEAARTLGEEGMLWSSDTSWGRCGGARSRVRGCTSRSSGGSSRRLRRLPALPPLTAGSARDVPLVEYRP